MQEIYIKLKIPLKELKIVNQELALPIEIKLSSFARSRRAEMLHEAISWPKGKNQENRKITKLYKVGGFGVAVGKPGKEAAPDFKGRHYITGEVTNNVNDMNPSVFKGGKKIEEDLTFMDMFEKIEHLMHNDLFGLEILGMLIFRMAFMLDHQKDKNGHWRYIPPKQSLRILKKRIPKINNVPTEIFLYFLDVLALNEDVKVHTLGHENAEHDYGRINTLLTFAHLIAVLLNRRSLAKFAGAFARPPSGMAPIPKTETGGIFDAFPLLSPKLLKS